MKELYTDGSIIYGEDTILLMFFCVASAGLTLDENYREKPKPHFIIPAYRLHDSFLRSLLMRGVLYDKELKNVIYGATKKK